MKNTVSKSKWTLWVSNETKKFGKKWSERHNESISQLVSSYLYRLRKIEEESFETTPIVDRITGVIRKAREKTRKDYKRHLEEKYLHD